MAAEDELGAGKGKPPVGSSRSAPRLTRLFATFVAVAVWLVAVSCAPVSGGTTARTSATSNVRAIAGVMAADFNLLVNALLDATNSQQSARSLFISWEQNGMDGRLAAVKSSLSALPRGEARIHYEAAVTLLDGVASDRAVLAGDQIGLVRQRARDSLRQAVAEWQKGDALLQ